MATVQALAARWLDDAFPGHVEVVLTDAAGRRHRLSDKPPVFGDERLAPDADYPMHVRVECDVLGQEVAGVVSVALRHGIESEDGLSQFQVAVTDVNRE